MDIYHIKQIWKRLSKFELFCLECYNASENYVVLNEQIN